MTQKRKKNKEKTKKKSATVTKKEGRYIGYCVLDWGKKVKEKGEGYLYLGFLLRPHNFLLITTLFFFSFNHAPLHSDCTSIVICQVPFHRVLCRAWHWAYQHWFHLCPMTIILLSSSLFLFHTATIYTYIYLLRSLMDVEACFSSQLDSLFVLCWFEWLLMSGR